MDAMGSARPASDVADGVCIWCREPIADPADREVHVSLLGAPGEFHRACFAEYEQSQS